MRRNVKRVLIGILLSVVAAVQIYGVILAWQEVHGSALLGIIALLPSSLLLWFFENTPFEALAYKFLLIGVACLNMAILMTIIWLMSDREADS